MPRGYEVEISLQCRTAAKDRLEDCIMVGNTRAPDRRFEKQAICSAKFFRVRATDPSGKIAVGTTVTVPYRMSSPP